MRKYVINLDRSTKRLKQFTESAHKIDLSFERIDALDARSFNEDFDFACFTENVKVSECVKDKDGKNLFQSLGMNYNDQKARKYLGRSLNAGEIACFLSHMKTLKQFLKTSSYYALIFEDDVKFLESTKTSLANLESVLLSLPQSPYDVIHLGSSKNKYVFDALSINNKSTVFGSSYFPMGAYGLLWSRQGAQNFVNQTKEIFAPFDVYLRHWLAHTGRGGVIIPKILHVQSGDSTIDDDLNVIPENADKSNQNKNSRTIVNQTIRKKNKAAFYLFYRLRRVYLEKKWALQKVILNRFH